MRGEQQAIPEIDRFVDGNLTGFKVPLKIKYEEDQYSPVGDGADWQDPLYEY